MVLFLHVSLSPTGIVFARSSTMRLDVRIEVTATSETMIQNRSVPSSWQTFGQTWHIALFRTSYAHSLRLSRQTNHFMQTRMGCKYYRQHLSLTFMRLRVIESREEGLTERSDVLWVIVVAITSSTHHPASLFRPSFVPCHRYIFEDR